MIFLLRCQDVVLNTQFGSPAPPLSSASASMRPLRWSANVAVASAPTHGNTPDTIYKLQWQAGVRCRIAFLKKPPFPTRRKGGGRSHEQVQGNCPCDRGKAPSRSALFLPKSGCWIHTACTQGGRKSSQSRSHCESDCRANERKWIVRIQPDKMAVDQIRQAVYSEYDQGKISHFVNVFMPLHSFLASKVIWPKSKKIWS
jgi:hypothetical protein